MALVAEANQILYNVTDSDLELIMQLCLPHKIICENMGVSHMALRKRTERLMLRMGVENQRALIVKALQLQLVSIDTLSIREFDGRANLS